MKQGWYERAPVPYREVVAVVAAPPKTAPHLWYKEYAGTARKAIEIVTKEGVVLYLDNEDGSGEAAVLTPPGKSLPGYRVFATTGLVSAEGSPLVPSEEGRAIPQPPAAAEADTPAALAAAHAASVAPSGKGGGGGALDAARAEIEALKAKLAEAEAAAKTASEASTKAAAKS